jgi:lysophospholipase L1-like esterase
MGHWKKSNLSILALATLLAACGGGGGGDHGADAPAPVWTSQKLSEPVTCDQPRVVKIQLFGDSTQWGLDGATNSKSANNPGDALQRLMDARYGVGRVAVENRAVGATTSANLLMGTDGLNKPWPQSVDADITLLNFGINDRILVPPGEYIDNLKRLTVSVYETPNPIHLDGSSVNNYAQWMREVAAEADAPVADANAYVRSLPNWQSDVPDGLHPNTELYGMIVENVLMPALVPLVERAACDGKAESSAPAWTSSRRVGSTAWMKTVYVSGGRWASARFRAWPMAPRW